MSYSWLPPTLEELADVAGLDAALAMAAARGGSRVSIPATPKAGNWLVKAVGLERARLICDHYRTGVGSGKGTVLDLPLSPKLWERRRRIDALIRDGVSADKIAVKTQSHRRTVFRRKAQMQKPPKASHKQSDLFD